MAIVPDRAERFRTALVCGWVGWLLAYAYTLWQCWVCGVGSERLLVAVASPFSVAMATAGALLGWIATAVRQRKARKSVSGRPEA